MNSPSWSYERLLNYAPDSRTLSQARGLFFAKRWKTLEGNGQYLWGEYETVHGHQHKAFVRLEPPFFRCSCKSRRRPCKHSLALVLLFLNRPDVWVVKEEIPEWAAHYIQQKEASKPPKVNASQQEKRILLMDQGVAELEKWLLNIIQQGLAQFTNPSDWENLAARMVDAKLGSIARRLRYCKTLFLTENWLDSVTQEVGSLYLFVRAWQQKSSLTKPKKQTLLQAAGWNIRKDSILQNAAIKDNWLVLGLTTGTEDKLTFRRTWFRGETTKRLALILDFSYGNRGFEDHWVLGSVLDGELVFYPGDAAIRAIFKTYQSSRAAYDFKPGYQNFHELGEAYSTILAISPWVQTFPCLLNNVYPEFDKKTASFTLWDKEGQGLLLNASAATWQFLSISGGQSLTVFGEYNGHSFTALSVIDKGSVIGLG